MDAPDPARALDFWIGRWRCTWEGGSAVNEIAPVVDGGGLQERFVADDGSLYGTSLSMYSQTDACWRQVWIDSDGSWIDLKGGPHEEGFYFQTPHGEVVHRMVFSNIHRDSLSWRWEKSDEHGDTWVELWAIAYERIAR